MIDYSNFNEREEKNIVCTSITSIYKVKSINYKKIC